MSDNVTREPTFGEKAAGVSFNPGGLEAVNTIKRSFADLIADLNTRRAAERQPRGDANAVHRHHGGADRADVGGEGRHLAVLM